MEVVVEEEKEGGEGGAGGAVAVSCAWMLQEVR